MICKMAFNYTYNVMKPMSHSLCCRIVQTSSQTSSYVSYCKSLSCRPNQIKNIVYYGKALINNDEFIRKSYSVKFSMNESDKNIPQVKGISKNILDKVKYNCILCQDLNLSWHRRKKLHAERKLEEKTRRMNEPDIPFSLKYVDESLCNTNKNSNEKEESVVFPYDIQPYMVTRSAFQKCDLDTFYSDREIDSHSEFVDKVVTTKDWLKGYEFYDDNQNKNCISPLHLNYGTSDKSVPISSVPCGGCGAYLQCQDTGIPGYLPSELMKNRAVAELRSIKCQRCHFLEKYNMALNVNVPHDEYPRLLAPFKDEVALAVLMVDLLDFPCSLWPGIIDIVGKKRPVIVVGNKVDLLPRDSPNFLSDAKSWLEQAVNESELSSANIKDVVLVSAQTGFGVEELITRIHVVWGYKGDVYLLGCTNVGKSTLFNALLRSDFCKVQAMDIMQRATTSPWPGTTLNLLKFPILRFSDWRLYERVKRLRSLTLQKHDDAKLLRKQLKMSKNPREATLIGHIGCTFGITSSSPDMSDPFSVRPNLTGDVQLQGLNPYRKDFRDGKWCYDTPGTVHPDQIIDILTAQELVHLLPREMILPRTFSLFTGDTLLVGGLGRLDFESGAEKTRFTVFAANTLPITVCRTSDVDQVYEALAAANLLIVPTSKPERLSLWPGLSACPQTIEIHGINSGESAADVVLSSAGWIAVTPRRGDTCLVRAWTPFARGIHVRVPALLKFSVNLRGKKVGKTPSYTVGRAVRV